MEYVRADRGGRPPAGAFPSPLPFYFTHTITHRPRLLRWLALLLIRIIETHRPDLAPRAPTSTGSTPSPSPAPPAPSPATDPTKPQTDLYARLDLPLPKKIIEIAPAQP